MDRRGFLGLIARSTAGVVLSVAAIPVFARAIPSRTTDWARERLIDLLEAKIRAGELEMAARLNEALRPRGRALESAIHSSVQAYDWKQVTGTIVIHPGDGRA